MAQILGYQSYANLVVQDLMALDTTRVQQFINDMQRRLTPLAERELARLKDLKEQEFASSGWQYDGKFYLWDQRYYKRLLFETEYQVDELQVSEYFSLERTVEGMLRIFEDLMGFVFI